MHYHLTVILILAMIISNQLHGDRLANARIQVAE